MTPDVLERLEEILARAETPDIAGTPDTHVLPQWAEDLRALLAGYGRALTALRLVSSNPISNEAQKAVRACLSEDKSHD